MTIVIRRPAGLLAVLATAGVVLAGCASGPGQAGSAAIVGNTAISVDQIQQELNTVLASQPIAQRAQQQNQLDELARNLLTQHVMHQLVGQVAASAGLSVSDQEVDQAVSQGGGADKLAANLFCDPANVPSVVRDTLLEAQLVNRYASSLSITMDYVTTQDPQDALAKVRQYAADPAAMRPLMDSQSQAAQSQGAAHGQQDFQLTLSGYLQELPNLFQQYSQDASNGQQDASPIQQAIVFGVRANTVVTFPIAAQQGTLWVVALVKSRTADPSGQTDPSLTAGLQPNQLGPIGMYLMSSMVAGTDIRISPRYGQWDSAEMQVVSGPGQGGDVAAPVHVAGA